MFGDYTIKEPSNTNTHSRYVSKTSAFRNESSDSIIGKRLENKKAKVEELKEKLEKEKKELEMTLQKSLQSQLDFYRNSYEDKFIDDPLVHQLNLAFIATTSGYKYGSRYDEVKGSFNAASIDFNKNNNAINFASFKEQGLKYSSKSGQKLAKDIANNSVGFTGYCSRHVRQALERTGLYNGHTASAYQMGALLAQNTNFQEVSPDSVNLKQLPAGCILVYDRGAAGYNAEHGHIEVTLGDGTACSDGRTYNLRNSQNMRIFVPVEQV